MTKDFLLNLLEIEDLSYLPAAIFKILEGDISSRDSLYKALLKENKYDLSFDWFQQIYESELSDRKQKKQDFTPNSIGVLTSMLTNGKEGVIYEPTAGNGSMIISDWWQRCKGYDPWEHYPGDHMVNCWELSSRAIPILLLNLSIRGIIGYVYHGDVLEKTVKAKYILLNRSNYTLGFSEIIKDVNNEFKIKKNEI